MYSYLVQMLIELFDKVPSYPERIWLSEDGCMNISDWKRKLCRKRLGGKDLQESEL